MTGSRTLRGLLAAALIAGLLWTITSSPAQAALAVVQTLGTAAVKTAGTTLSITVPTGGVARGNSVVVTVAMDDTTGAISVSDGSGIPYSLDVNQETNTGTSSVRAAILSRHDVAAIPAGTTITVTTPSVTARAIVVLEVSGIESTSPLDQTAGASGSSATPSSGTVGTTQADEVLIGAIAAEAPSNESGTPGPGWTAAATPAPATSGNPLASNVTNHSQHAVVSATGSFQADGTLGASRDWAAVISTYKKDVTAPAVGLSAPADSVTTTDTTPTFSGSAGNKNSDSDTVTVRVFSGATEVRTLPTTRAGTNWSVDASPALADGTYTWTAEQADANQTGTSATRSFTVDTTADPPNVDSAPTDPSNDDSPSWAFSGEPGATFECELRDSGDNVVDPLAGCTSPYGFDLSGEADDDYTFRVRQTDAVGNVSSFATSTYTLDRAANAPAIDAAPADPSADATPEWEFSGEPGTTFECELRDSGDNVVDPLAGCTSPYAFDLSGEADDDYTFRVRQTDAATNVSSFATSTFTLDRTADLPSIDDAPDDPSNDDTPEWGFSGEAGATFECKLEGSSGTVDPLAGCTSPYTFDLSGGADDDYTFSVRQTDGVGNVSGFATSTFSLDRASAAPSIDVEPDDPSNGQNPEWEFSGEAGATYECRLENTSGTVDALAACTSPYTFDLSGEADDDYTFSVRQTDGAGNVSGFATSTFTLDTVALAPTFDVEPDDPSSDATPAWEFSGEPGATFDCELSDPGGVVDTAAGCTSPYTFDLGAEPDDEYTLEVTQTDTAGNVSPAASSTFTLDRIANAPTIDTFPDDPSNDETPEWTFSGEPGATFACTLSDSQGQIDSDPTCTAPYSFDLSSAADDDYTFAVTQTDAAGNGSLAASDTFTLDTVALAPSFISTPDDETNDTTPSWGFSGEAGATFACTLTLGATEVDSDADCGTSYTAPLLADGTYELAVMQTDALGNVSVEATDTIVVDTQAPDPPTPGDPPPAQTNDETPTVDWSGEPGATYECVIDPPGGPPTAPFPCAPPHTFDLTSFVDGAFTISVTQLDAAGNPSATPLDVSFTLDTQAPLATPLITSTPKSPNRLTTPGWGFTPGSGDAMQCQLRRGLTIVSDWTNCTSPKTYDLSAQPSGTYRFSVRHVDAAGNGGVALTAGDYVYDRIAPVVSSLKASRNPFSLRKGSTVISFKTNEAGKGAVIIKKGTKTVRKLGTKSLGAGATGKFKWDGKDSKGRKVRVGKYSAVVTMTDAAGNKTTRKLTITVKR